MKISFRNANIGIAATAAVMAVGATFFHHSEAAIEAVTAVGLVVGLAVLFGLDWRDDRSHRKSHRPH